MTKSPSLAARIGIKTAHNLLAASILLGAIMVASIETPKESVQREGLSDKDRATLCATQDALRPDC